MRAGEVQQGREQRRSASERLRLRNNGGFGFEILRGTRILRDLLGAPREVCVCACACV